MAENFPLKLRPNRCR